MVRGKRTASSKRHGESPQIVADVLGISGEKSVLGISQASPFKILTKKDKTQRETDEICGEHKLQIMAYDEEGGAPLCEQCVYSGLGKRPVFTATVARELSTEFTKQYTTFEDSCEELDALNQTQIREKMQDQTQRFFELIRNHVDLLERQVSKKIEESSNLGSLITSLENMHQYMDENSIAEKYDREESTIKDKIKENRFTYVCRRKDHFNKVITDMTKDNTKLQSCLTSCRKNITQILNIDNNEEKIESQLNDLVGGLIQIDMKNFTPDTVKLQEDPMSPFQQEIEKEMKVQAPVELEPQTTDELKNYYYVEDGKLKCRGLGKNNKVKAPTNVVSKLDYYFSKIITVPQESGKERVFVFGGTTDEGGNDPVPNCFEVSIGKKKSTLTPIADMPTARVSFACSVSQDSNYIYVVGGCSGANKTPTNVCEIFSIETGAWSSIDDISQPRFSASVIENNQELFLFGGQDTSSSSEHYNLKSIEWIDLKSENPTWEVLAEELPFAAAFSGAIALHPREILIFGGWDKQNDIDNCVLLKESSPGDFAITDADSLQDADKFLVLGPRHRDESNRNIVIFGTEHVHQYNEIEKNFMTLK